MKITELITRISKFSLGSVFTKVCMDVLLAVLKGEAAEGLSHPDEMFQGSALRSACK